MGVTLTSPRPAHGALNWDTAMEADLTALAGGINTAVTINGTNLNSLTQSGVYVGNTLTNAPGGSTQAFLIWENFSTATAQAQIAVDYGTGAVWTRKMQSTVPGWSAWVQVVTSASDTGWVTASTGITAATGWTLNNSQYRNINGVVTIYLNLTRTGAALTASAAGIVTPTNAVVLPAGLIPARSNGVISAVGTASTVAASCYANSNGNIVLSNVAPSQSVAVNGVLELMGTFLL